MRTRYTKRIDRANRTRSALARKSRGRLRLSVFRSSKHIYAQVIDDVRGVTLAAASPVDTALKAKEYDGKPLKDDKFWGGLLAACAVFMLFYFK